MLTTRWRHLWCSVPCLNIDHDEFRTEYDESSDDDGYADDHDDDFDDDHAVRDWKDFEDFTTDLMLHTNLAMLDSFRLHVGDGKLFFRNRIAAGWVRRAIKYCTPAGS